MLRFHEPIDEEVADREVESSQQDEPGFDRSDVQDRGQQADFHLRKHPRSVELYQCFWNIIYGPRKLTMHPTFHMSIL